MQQMRVDSQVENAVTLARTWSLVGVGKLEGKSVSSLQGYCVEKAGTCGRSVSINAVN